MKELSDQELELLLAGTGPSGRHELDGLVHFVKAAKKSSSIPPSPAIQQRHIREITEITRTAQLNAEKGEPVVRPASKALGPVSQVSGLPKRRRKPVLSFLTPLVAKIVALAMALASVVGTGALAANGELPRDIQDNISDLVSDLGIDIPSGDDAIDDAGDQVDETLDDAGDDVDNVADGVDDQLDDAENAVDQDDQTDDGQEGDNGTKQHPHCDDEVTPQQAGKRSNYDVHQAICSTEPGPERGQAVSAAARQKPAVEQPNTEEPGDDQDSGGDTQSNLTQNGPGSGNEGPKGKALGHGKHQGR